MRTATVILVLCCLHLASCVRTPVADRTTGRRLEGSEIEYSDWRVQQFSYIGLKVDLPSEASVSPSAKGPATLSIAMHYLSPPPGLLDDATVFVEIYIERITRKQVEDRKMSYLESGLYKRGHVEDHDFWFWYYDLHPETSRSDGKGSYTTYRRDVLLKGTELLHVWADVLNAGPVKSQETDHKAVERILDSIVPVDTGPAN